MSDGHDENACLILAVHDEIGKACRPHALCAEKVDGPSMGRVRDSIQRCFELFREPRRHAWVALRVPRSGLFGLGEGGGEELKEFHGGRSRPQECDAAPPAKGSA